MPHVRPVLMAGTDRKDADWRNGSSTNSHTTDRGPTWLIGKVPEQQLPPQKIQATCSNHFKYIIHVQATLQAVSVFIGHTIFWPFIHSRSKIRHQDHTGACARRPSEVLLVSVHLPNTSLRCLHWTSGTVGTDTPFHVVDDASSFKRLAPCARWRAIPSSVHVVHHHPELRKKVACDWKPRQHSQSAQLLKQLALRHYFSKNRVFFVRRLGRPARKEAKLQVFWFSSKKKNSKCKS